MEAVTPKRKYKKRETEGKITVKHFLNKQIKITHDDHGELPFVRHPVYVLVTVKRQNTWLKSRINRPFNEEEQFWINGKPVKWHEALKDIIERERAGIERVVRSLKPFEKENFKIRDVASKYNSLKAIDQLVNEALIKEVESYQGSRSVKDHLFRNPLGNGLSYLGKGLLALEFRAVEDPSVRELRNVYPSHIWFFDYYYQKFIIGLYGQPEENLDFLSMEPFIDDVESGKFQTKFVDYFKSVGDEEVAKAIIDDLNKLLISSRLY